MFLDELKAGKSESHTVVIKHTHSAFLRIGNRS